MARRILISLLFLAALADAQGLSAPASGAVAGVVLDDANGSPIAGATVWCPSADNPMRPSTISDSQGRFLLDGVPPRPYEVFLSAYKESDGYPQVSFAFFKTSGREYPSAKVEAGKTTRDIVIRLTRAAHLNLEITNNMGLPIDAGDVMLEFTRDDDPKYGNFGTSVNAPRVSMLVPPVHFRFTVRARGYRPWPSEVLAPKSGETVGVTVRLERE